MSTPQLSESQRKAADAKMIEVAQEYLQTLLNYLLLTGDTVQALAIHDEIRATLENWYMADRPKRPVSFLEDLRASLRRDPK